MTTMMQNYALTWTDADGRARASAVAYDKPSVEREKAALKEAGATDIEVVPVKPGELPKPKA
jgi:hypothetical protein